jgi:hypothetical protein
MLLYNFIINLITSEKKNFFLGKKGDARFARV